MSAPCSASSASTTSGDSGTCVSCWARDSSARSWPASADWRASRFLRSALRCARDFATGLAGLLMRGVLATPAAVLAQLDSVRRIPPRLVRLVVAPLALLTREGDGDAYVSASHLTSSAPEAETGPNQKKDPGADARGWPKYSESPREAGALTKTAGSSRYSGLIFSQLFLMVSGPCLKATSLPLPQARMSPAGPPCTLSAPSAPPTLSTPSSPKSLSAPLLPLTRSSPSSPWAVSSPLPATDLVVVVAAGMSSLSSWPLRQSSPPRPQIVSLPPPPEQVLLGGAGHRVVGVVALEGHAIDAGGAIGRNTGPGLG